MAPTDRRDDRHANAYLYRAEHGAAARRRPGADLRPRTTCPAANSQRMAADMLFVSASRNVAQSQFRPLRDGLAG
jgi:hypothetical protein